jgi:hypothetical protein
MSVLHSFSDNFFSSFFGSMLKSDEAYWSHTLYLQHHITYPLGCTSLTQCLLTCSVVRKGDKGCHYPWVPRHVQLASQPKRQWIFTMRLLRSLSCKSRKNHIVASFNHWIIFQRLNSIS